VTDIGSVDEHATLPSQVAIQGETFYLLKNDNGYRLVSRTCPHAGGEVEDDGDELYCPHHYWRFRRDDGTGIFPPSCALQSFAVSVENGRLIAAYDPPPRRVYGSGG
jgi:nitrite reductase/ring-hydroxylating ferredoxin subunit